MTCQPSNANMCQSLNLSKVVEETYSIDNLTRKIWKAVTHHTADEKLLLDGHP